jgi:carboxyl-terminal processing protease
MGVRNGQPIVVNPIDGGPAQKAGIQAGDAVLRVNGEDVSRLGLSELTTRLRGDASSSVTLTVQHLNGVSPIDVTLTRQRVAFHPVSSYVLPDSNILDIRLTDFNASATSDLKAALQNASNQRVSGIILDLRDNPGGILDQAVDVASQFMDQGTVVIIRDSEGHERKLEAKSGGLGTKLPLTILVNSGTASAAEVVAGALQANHRATVIGQPTVGTGTVLSTFRLKDGSAILLGTQEWLTPTGQLLKGKGLQPDVAVRLTSQSSVVTPAIGRNMSSDQLQTSGDSQLLSAIKYLTDHPQVETQSRAA